MVTEINGSILGQVVDENNKAVADAIVHKFIRQQQNQPIRYFFFEM